MSEPTPAANDESARYWRAAWFAVWSPVAAWGGTLASLWASGLLPAWATGAVGVTAGACGLCGVLLVTAGAVESLHATLGPSAMSGGEKARLACLSIVGVLVSVFGYGSLVLFGGFVAIVSPLRDLQLG